MESEQRLKRKRTFPIRTVSFHPVLTVPGLSKNSLHDSSHGKLRLPLRVADRVLFPDHLLLLVSDKIHEDDKLDCVYHKALKGKDIVRRRVLSVDEFDGFRSVVRCLNPPSNYSAAVGLMWTGDDGVDDYGWSFRCNQTVHSWDRLVYEAAFDGKTAFVFAKGLNLRPHKESDLTKFMCQFGLKNIDYEEEGFVVMTEAILVAQEVVRCTLPRSIRNNLDSAQGIRVTIVHDPMPSAVRIRDSRSYEHGRNQRTMGNTCYALEPGTSTAGVDHVHAWLGVERWFIYDNNSDDGIQEVVEELDFQDYNVSRHNWPWIKTQEAGFSHCTLRARNECKWVGFFDVDEFYYFPHHHRRACHSFGPSGLSSTPLQGVTVGYTCRLQNPERHKSIVRPDLLNETLLNVVHHFELKIGFRYLNVLENSIIINHYKYQVWETFRAKFFRRVATYVVESQENQNQGSKDRAPGLGTEAIEPPNWRKQFCEVWDTGLRDFVLANLADPATGSYPGRSLFCSNTKYGC
ncbi:UPF0392 protein [Hibiscus syriacus]|uniref:Glycosyltransferase family 92 protein n=1 Tax=Hibiscus syriacus TaxID=106335 RepID=A0A6A3CRS7_HIBSY|nr:UPF0392 protein [Hibiscus syriacus]